jgi:hypothetical protein
MKHGELVESDSTPPPRSQSNATAAHSDAMKTALLLFSLALALSQALPSQNNSDRERQGLKGQAKRVFVGWSPLSEGWAAEVGAVCRRESQEFDPQGRLTLLVLYTDACGSGELRHYYSFDEDGSALERLDASRASTIGLSPDAPSSAKGRDRSEPFTARHAFRYDAGGRKVEASVTRPNGKLIYKVLYTYDSQGRWTGWESREGDGKLQGKYVLTYEGEGAFPTSSLSVGADGKPYSKSTYSNYRVNSRGDWVERKETTERLDYPRRPKTVALAYRSITYY